MEKAEKPETEDNSAMPCCGSPNVLDVSAGVTLRFNPRTRPRDGVHIIRICVSCGHIPDLKGLLAHPEDFARVSSVFKVGGLGTAATLGLPTLPEVERLCATVIIQTEAKYRIDEPVEPVPSEQLEGRLRRLMGFASSSRPKAYNCPGVDHPVITHTGLSEKFSSIRKDGDHCRFVRYFREVIENPAEVWLSADDGRPIFRILGILGTQSGTHFMNIVAEADDHICDTGYAVAYKPRVEGYREGKLLHIGWGLRI